MFDYGNGSDGALNLTSGTRNLALNTKHQFTTVNVSSGATLTGIGNGSVLYITATESITISGNLHAWNNVRGQSSNSVTINGEVFRSPSVADGGNGASIGSTTSPGGTQGSGFGGGGAGGWYNSPSRGGAGGSGSPSPGTGGTGVTGTSGASRMTAAGRNGGNSSGGSGGLDSGWGSGGGQTAISGAGGSAYGANGGRGHRTAGGNPQIYAGGGGGAGGRAAPPGMHIVLQAPSVTITGTVVTRELATKDGQKGGNGGAGYTLDGVFGDTANSYLDGAGGGGGGGTNGGNLYIRTNSLANSATYGMSGGTGGAKGTGYNDGYAGSNGSSGQVYSTIAQGPSKTLSDLGSQNITLVQLSPDYNLLTDSTYHDFYIDDIQVSGAAFLEVAGTRHTMTTPAQRLYSAQRLLTASTIHSIRQDDYGLIYNTKLALESLTHSQTANNISLSQLRTLQVLDTLHSLSDSDKRIINWDKLGVEFGRYKETYSNTGELRDLVNYIFESEDEIFIFEDEQGYGVLVPERQKETLLHINTYKLGGDLGVIIDALFESEDSMFYFESEDEKVLLGPEESKIPQAFKKNYKQKGRF